MQIGPSQNFRHSHSPLTEHVPLFWQESGEQTFVVIIVVASVVAMGNLVVDSSLGFFSSKYGKYLVLCHKTFVNKLIFIRNARICHCIFRNLIECLAFTENL